MLYLIATPIGNLEDITLRALSTLKDVDYILAEDTRKTGFLLKRFDIKKSLVSFYDHNAVRKIPQIISDLKADRTIALVSSAGTPTISDPGFKLVRACRKDNIEVTSLPGACSLVNALTLSSYPHEKFIFLGYLPRKKSQIKKIIEPIRDWDCAIVFLESPYRVVSSLKEIKAVLGDVKVTVAREMTKKFEETLEGDISKVLEIFEGRKPKGEFTIVLNNRDNK